jgi:hypothetical protein
MAERKYQSVSILIIILFAIVGFGISFWKYKTALVLEPLRINGGTDSVYYVKDTVDQITYDFKATQIFKPGQVLFHRAPVFLVWIMLVLVMITVASGSFPVFAMQAWNLKRNFRFPNWQFLLLITMAIVFVWLLSILPQFLPGYIKPFHLVEKFKVLLYNPNMILYSVAVTLGLIIPILLVVFMIGPASDKIRVDSRSQESFEIAARQLNRLFEVLLMALQVLAVIVVLAVLTSRTLHESFRSVIRIENIELPREISYVYGLYFSLFLAIILIPTYYHLRLRSSSFRLLLNDYLDKTGSKTDSKWPERMATAFTLKTSALETLKLTLTVLAPLISSFLPDEVFR